jgi:hypothetical protein
MNFYLTVIFGLTIGIAAVAGLAKMHQAERGYLPFLLLLCIGFGNELTSIYFTYRYHNNIINYNIYLLVEALIILWQFRKWRLFQRRQKLYSSLQVLFVLAWCTESFILSDIYNFNRYSLILFSFFIVALSIFQIAYMIFFETNNLLQHARFIICVGFVVFFCAQIITESIGLYGLHLSKDFRTHVQTLFEYVNLFTNLLFILAVLWMPTKPRYILQLQSASVVSAH